MVTTLQVGRDLFLIDVFAVLTTNTNNESASGARRRPLEGGAHRRPASITDKDFTVLLLVKEQAATLSGF